jgi:hypothetical protein
MKWLHEQGCPYNESTFSAAAFNGNLETLAWLKDRGFSWNHMTFESAASNGDLQVLKWLKEQGCPWNEYTFSGAAKKGNLETLVWLKEQGCPIDEKRAFYKALSNPKLDILKFIHDNASNNFWDTTRDSIIIKSSYSIEIKCVGIGCSTIFSTYKEICSSEVLEWLYENNYLPYI